ncbi:MAG: OmpH family outer membrane protein [Crocinitomicaceae bacterium]|nr:OmpH family outer membrane protein [Crocinitomicaceae bacterium]
MKKLLLAIVLILGAGTINAQTKIGHVNSQALMDTLPSRKVAIEKLIEFERAGIAELQEMEADFNLALQKYEAERPNMSPVIIKIEEEKLMKKQQALQEREQSLNNEMQAYSNELNQPILEMVQGAVQKVAELNKLNYVIDESVTLYFAGGVDITDQVVTELLKMDAQ